MLASMSNELQKQYDSYKSSTSILLHLQELYGGQSRTARFNVSKELFQAKMAEGSSVNEHVLKMIGYIEQLKKLDVGMDADLQIDLQSLPGSFSQFVMNFNMSRMTVPLHELLNMLTTAEGSIKKTKGSTFVIHKASTSKSKPKGKEKWKG